MAKSKKNNKKKAKKNSNYKNEVIEKKVPKKSEKNQKEIDRKAKIKEKEKKKEEKVLAKKQKTEEKLKIKEEKSSKNEKLKKEKTNKVQKPEKEENKAKAAKNVEIERAEIKTLADEIAEAKKQESAEEATEPAEEATEPAEETAEPAEETVDPEEETVEPAEVPKNTLILEEVVLEKESEKEPEPSPQKEEKKKVKKEKVERKQKQEKKDNNKKADSPKSSLPQISFKKFDLEKIKSIKITKWHVIIAIVAVITLAALISVLSVIGIKEADNAPAVYSGRDYADDEVSVIAISDEQQHQLVKDTNAKGDTRKFSFYAKTQMNVDRQDSLLPVAISNPSSGKHILLCSIVNEDGVVVYRSLGIEPGKYVNNIQLSHYLEFGMNELTLYVSAFDPVKASDELLFDRVGTQKVKLKVVCGGDYQSE